MGALAARLGDRLDVRHEALRAVGTAGLEDLYVAFTALRSDVRVDRRRVVELLENVLPRDVFREPRPLVDPVTEASGRRERGRRTHGIQAMSREDRLEELAGDSDPWISMLCRREPGRQLDAEHASHREA